MATYFNNDFVAFFRELEMHNDRDWFNTNKKRYESVVKQPFELFVTDLIEKMHQQDHRILLTPKDAIFRIYKDTRFSADKTPYKIFASAIVAPGGRKDHNADGIYIEFGGQHARMYSGAYMPEKEPLMKIRQKIASEPEHFAKLIADQAFIKNFGEIRGDKNKVIPGELKEAAKGQPLIYNKAFYYFTEWKPEAITRNGFLDEIIDRYQIIKPITRFLIDAIK